MKVYCKQCKYLVTDYVSSIRKCAQPDVVGKKTIDSWYERVTIETYGDPRKLNAANDCSLFYEGELDNFDNGDER